MCVIVVLIHGFREKLQQIECLSSKRKSAMNRGKKTLFLHSICDRSHLFIPDVRQKLWVWKIKYALYWSNGPIKLGKKNFLSCFNKTTLLVAVLHSQKYVQQPGIFFPTIFTSHLPCVCACTHLQFSPEATYSKACSYSCFTRVPNLVTLNFYENPADAQEKRVGLKLEWGK